MDNKKIKTTISTLIILEKIADKKKLYQVIIFVCFVLVFGDLITIGRQIDFVNESNNEKKFIDITFL